jgi:DNA topoisomerase I
MNIERKKRGKKFIYLKKGNIIKDEKILNRIKKLVIPPGWKKVCISNNSNDNIQCIGYDDKNRKQYKYNEDYIKKQNIKKYYKNLINFGEKINIIRNEIFNLLKNKSWMLEKTIAFIILILDKCHLRIGNEKYKEENESYGITTLEKRHIVIKPTGVYFNFTGKKGVHNSCIFKDKNIISLFRALYKEFRHNERDNFFKYYNSKNEICNINSHHINDFLKQFGDFSAKNFRTWCANEYIIIYLLNSSKEFKKEELNELSERKCNIIVNKCIDLISNKLNNTRAICKKSYICNNILDDFKENRNNFINELKLFSKSKLKNCSKSESILLKLLKKYKLIY